jgi:hypothetical protein
MLAGVIVISRRSARVSSVKRRCFLARRWAFSCCAAARLRVNFCLCRQLWNMGNSSVSGKMPSKKNGIAADRGHVIPNGACRRQLFQTLRQATRKPNGLRRVFNLCPGRKDHTRLLGCLRLGSTILWVSSACAERKSSAPAAIQMGLANDELPFARAAFRFPGREA